MSAQPEVWRVSTVEGIFETDLETLKQWIVEGCVLPTDKVTKGSQSWIEAGRVPKLKAAFDGDVRRVAPPPTTNSFEAFVESNPEFRSQSEINPPASSTTWNEPTDSTSASQGTTACHNHPEAEPDYVCRVCGALFCKHCPKFVSGKVPVCPLCGDLCHEYRAVVEKAERAQFQSSGFGVEDFKRAVRYPLQHKFALFGGAVIYGVLLLAGVRGSIVAWVLLFGCMSHVISQVAWGRFSRSFMPDFSSFSLLDDLVVPVFLGLGIMIVSWGPLIALVLALLFGVLSGGVAQPSPLAGANQVAESDKPDFSVLTDPNADPAKLEAENKKLQQLRPGAQMAREAEQSKEEASDPLGVARDLLPYLGAGASIGLLFLLCFAWGLFYHPMAFAVAGYTQSIGSVLNPLVGIDTIRRMGLTYFKAFAMVMAVQVVSVVIGIVIAIITSPFALPFVGNVVSNFLNATFTFYFNLVIACILGLSLFKCADRLGITVD
jgi:hypothetical protein